MSWSLSACYTVLRNCMACQHAKQTMHWCRQLLYFFETSYVKSLFIT